MKSEFVKVKWIDLDDILEKYQEYLLKNEFTLSSRQEQLWGISQKIRELCLNSELNAEIIILENPF